MDLPTVHRLFPATLALLHDPPEHSAYPLGQIAVLRRLVEV